MEHRSKHNSKKCIKLLEENMRENLQDSNYLTFWIKQNMTNKVREKKR